MRHFRSLDNLQLQDTWLTIGSYDGVHRGHQTLIRGLVEGARSAGAQAVVFTFDPHPVTVLRPGKPLALLTGPDEKAELLAALGVDILVTYPFDRATSDLTAEQFLGTLKEHLGFKQLWVGYDFAMGKNRQGNTSELRRLGPELDFELHVITPVQAGDQPVSSSLIRKLIAEGDIQSANQFLGYPYGLRGRVVAGARRGRLIGIPTANLEVPANRAVPRTGVYVSSVSVAGKLWTAVTNVGIRPTFDQEDNQVFIETHLLDFSQDMYGQEIKINFLHRLRDEQRFPGVEALVQQIQSDISQARQLMEVPHAPVS